VKLITHLHLVPRSKNEWMYTSAPPIRLNSVVLTEGTGTILTLPLQITLSVLHSVRPFFASSDCPNRATRLNYKIVPTFVMQALDRTMKWGSMNRLDIAVTDNSLSVSAWSCRIKDITTPAPEQNPVNAVSGINSPRNQMQNESIATRFGHFTLVERDPCCTRLVRY
jgi:hypothetical protein